MAGQRSIASAIVDADEFLRGLERALDRLEVQTERDVQRLVIDVQNRARAYCPVDTGTLRRSIGHARGEDANGVYFDVGTKVTYAVFVEYGTRSSAQQPFLRPALAEAVSAFRPGRS